MNASSELLKELRLERSKGPAPPPPSRRGRWIVLGLVAVAAVAVVAWLVSGRDRAVEVGTAPVVAISGAGNASASVLDASGYVVARRMATVSAQITGRVKEVTIEEGMRVEAGQVMATLDPIDADAQRRLYASQAEAARSQIDSIGAQLREAEANAERLGPLVRQQLVSQAQYDQAVAQRDALRAQLAVTRRNAQVAGEQLRISEVNLDHTVVRAPFSGVVIAKAAQPGEIVSPLSAGGGFTRTGIGTIVDMESLEVEVEVGESYIGRVQPRMPVETVLNSYPDWRIPGEVIANIPAADRGKATVKVRVALHEKDARIVPDMGVRVSFLEAPRPDGEDEQPRGVRVPAAAVVDHDGGKAAFVVGPDNTVELRKLKVGGKLGGDMQVLEGLAPGETVVVAPPDALEDGARISTP